MTLAVRSYSTATYYGTGGTVAIAKPAGCVDGDILLMIMDPVLGKSVTPPAGWTSRGTSGGTSLPGGQSMFIQTYAKVASSEGSSYNFTVSAGSGSAKDFISILLCISGSTASYFDTSSNGSNNAYQTSLANAALTTAVANELLVWAGMIANDSTITVPSGFTQVTTYLSPNAYSWTNPSSKAYRLTVATKLQVASGSTGTVTGTAGTAAGWETWMGAIKPSTVTAQFWTDFIKCAEVDS
jgi:hypothetical protein